MIVVTETCPPPTPGSVASGLVLWLDGSDANADGTSPTDGNPVLIWKDRSIAGNDATLHVGQNAPVFVTNQINGKSVLRFSRVADNLGSVLKTDVDIRPTITEDVTVFTVYKHASIGDNMAPWGSDDGNWDRFFISAFSSTVDGVASFGPAPPYYTPVVGSGVPGSIRLLTAVYDGKVLAGSNSGPVDGSSIYFNG